mmetsp:Transcript_30150/g.41396  ORF Transcript_30150/g.41396 Transcript_30150/m.41396 type:complete len:182 (+) Transcript_30150:785-1330(+)
MDVCKYIPTHWVMSRTTLRKIYCTFMVRQFITHWVIICYNMLRSKQQPFWWRPRSVTARCKRYCCALQFDPQDVFALLELRTILNPVAILVAELALHYEVFLGLRALSCSDNFLFVGAGVGYPSTAASSSSSASTSCFARRRLNWFHHADRGADPVLGLCCYKSSLFIQHFSVQCSVVRSR